MKNMKSVFLILLLAAAGTLFPMTGLSASPKLQDGIYTASAEGKDSTIKVQVTITAGKIAEVKILDQNETAGVSDAALERLPKEIVENQTADVDAVTGASETSNAIIDATKNCLKQAAGKK